MWSLSKVRVGHSFVTVPHVAVDVIQDVVVPRWKAHVLVVLR